MNYDPYQGDMPGNKVPLHERDGGGFGWVPLVLMIVLFLGGIYLFSGERPNAPGTQPDRVTQSTQPSPR
jgi:hypothetical protein